MNSQWIGEFSKKVGAELCSAIKLSASLSAQLHKTFLEDCERWNTRRVRQGALFVLIGSEGVICATHIAAMIYAATPQIVLGVFAFCSLVSAFGVGSLSTAISHQRFIQANRTPRP